MSTLRISLPQSAASPARARRLVSAFAAEHDLLGSTSVALLVLSELVTNAVLHGSEPITVAVGVTARRLCIEVSDGSPDAGNIAPQVPRSPDVPGGRGLHIVNSLAQSWGITRHDDCKVVWAEVDLVADHDEPDA